MERNITKSLLVWKEKQNRKPLIVRGARQTGKSFSITAFGNSEFEGTTHIINFERRPDLHLVFEQNYEFLNFMLLLPVLYLNLL